MTISFHNTVPSNTTLTRQLTFNSIYEKLSTGKKINRAADDAASLSISSKLRTQIRGLKIAERNSQDGISMVQIAESAMRDVQSTLQRLRELSVQGSNGTLTASDRSAIQQEASELLNHIDNISLETSFNDIKLFTSEIKTSINNVTVGTTRDGIPNNHVVLAATLEVPEGDNDLLVVRGFFNKISGDLFPDINVYSPEGELFGWWPTSYGGNSKLNNSKGSIEDSQNKSSENAFYSGWASNPEYMRFENPVSGTWYLYAQNFGGTDPSSYNVGYDYVGAPKTFTFQVGPNTNNQYEVEMSNVSTLALDLDRISFLTIEDSQNALEKLDEAIDYTLSEVGKYGAYHNGLSSIIKNITNYETNLVSTDSQLTDLDMAKGMMDLTKQKLLQQVDNSLKVHNIDSKLSFASLLFNSSNSKLTKAN